MFKKFLHYHGCGHPESFMYPPLHETLSSYFVQECSKDWTF